MAIHIKKVSAMTFGKTISLALITASLARSAAPASAGMTGMSGINSSKIGNADQPQKVRFRRSDRPIINAGRQGRWGRFESRRDRGPRGGGWGRINVGGYNYQEKRNTGRKPRDRQIGSNCAGQYESCIGNSQRKYDRCVGKGYNRRQCSNMRHRRIKHCQWRKNKCRR